MRRRKLQFVWHCHHDVLLEPLTQSITERRKYIKNTKPKNEVELRLKLFKPVKGKLPKEVIEAGKKFLYNNSTLWSIVPACGSSVENGGKGVGVGDSGGPEML